MTVVINGTTGITNPNSMTIGNGGGNVATNTAVGASALAANTTGSNNTAVGASSLASATTGIRNTAVGAQALFTNTTGENTAVGFTAGAGITTGTANAFVGGGLYGVSLSCGNSTTTGSYNTGLGHGALGSNTTANNNTAVGYQAGYSNTTGANITAIGYKAGYPATGDGGTFVGSNAGQAVTSGTQNTFVGLNAGYFVTTGSNNTVIGGFNGNQGGLDIRTASNYIVLSDGNGNPVVISKYWGTGTTSSYFGISGVNYAGSVNACIVVGYDGNSSPAFRTYDSNSSATSLTAWSIFRNGSGVGQVYTTLSATTYATSSDYRLKNITGPMVGALERNALLQPKVGTWKVDGSDFEGFVAHELQEVFPQAAHGEKDEVDEDGNPVYQGVGTGPLDAHFAACINELKALIEAQAAEIAALKGQA